MSLDPPFGAFAATSLQKTVIGLAHATPLKRGTARGPMAGLVSALRPGPIDAGFAGANFRLRLDGSPTERAMLLNPDYNREELRRLRAAVGEDGVMVDVGANVGLYALPIAINAPGCRVIAIEPGPLAGARLAENIAANGLSNVAVAPVAIGEHEGEVRFTQDAVNLGHSHISDAGEIAVRMRPLAALLSGLGLSRIAALKIDIEGYEDRALAPFFAAWPAEGRPRCMVIEHTERDKWATDCLALLESFGYACAWSGRGNSVYEL